MKFIYFLQESVEAARVREERLKAYADKKAKKPGPIAKSSVLLDCKPWDDETDMAAMEAEIRKIEMDGLKWGAGKYLCRLLAIRKILMNFEICLDVNYNGLLKTTELLFMLMYIVFPE